MATRTAIRLVHPAAEQLRAEALAERRALARALAIEADWRYHDGPEWAARYWSAFGDLQAHGNAGLFADSDAVAKAVSRHSDWPALEHDRASQCRAIFRALLATLHPELHPDAATDARALQWPLVLRAYRGGDLPALRIQLRRFRSLRVSTALPDSIVALRRERGRLERARQAVDRRLAELSQTFPFCLRDNLADPSWVRRQRLALRQIRVMTSAPKAVALGRGANAGDRKQVS